MREISDEDYVHFQRLRKVFAHIYPEMSGQPFITGMSDKRDEAGFPEYLSLCSVYGLDDIVTYKKV